VIAVEEHPRFVPARRDANREAWRQRVEHFVARTSGLQPLNRSNGEILRGHDLRLSVSRAERIGVTPGKPHDGASPRRRATTRTSNASTGMSYGQIGKCRKSQENALTCLGRRGCGSLRAFGEFSACWLVGRFCEA
jgi:hypothetical protein